MKPRFLVPLLLTLGLLATSAGLGLTGSAISDGGFDLAQDNGSAGGGGGGGGGGGNAGGGVDVGTGGGGDDFAGGGDDLGTGGGGGDGGTPLAFTGLVALPLLIGGLAMLGGGLVLRRRLRA